MIRRLLTLLVLVLLLAMPLGAHAENYAWSDPQFDFAGINKIQLYASKVQDDVIMRNFYYDPSAGRTMEQLIQIALSQKGYTLLIPRSESEVIKAETDTSLRPDMLDADINVYKYGHTKVYVPSRVEEYTSYEKITHVDKYGRKSETTIPVVRTRVVPAYDYYTVFVDVEIMLYDPISHKNVFTYRDTRSRGAESDPTSMARRIAESFVKELEKVKKKHS